MRDATVDQVKLAAEAGGRNPAATQSPNPGGGGPARRPYRAPRLVCYGKLDEVTRFGGSQVVDSGASSFGQVT